MNNMNAYVHSQISVKNRGGKIEDYICLHDFADCSKEIEPSNSHRLYWHTMWGIKNVVMKIFGHTFQNSDGKIVNVKDLMESDHVLPDYHGKFIPDLSDFVDCIDEDETDLERIKSFQVENSSLFKNREIKELMLSPLAVTGKVKSLLVTHNSWFAGYILPKMYKRDFEIKNYSISPRVLFNRMNFKNWMQNGQETPPSHIKLCERRVKKRN